MTDPRIFFDLETFSHTALWKEDDPVWAALEKLSTYLQSFPHHIDIPIPAGVYLENRDQITIGAGTILEPGAFVRGPCIIGKNCTLRHSAYIRDGVILGDACVVGHGSEVKHSILLNHAQAAHFCYVGDSVIGSRVNLGAGVKCANLRLDRQEVSVFPNGTKVRTGLKKLGAILGDSAQVGCNCVLNPGTLVGQKAVIYPLLNVGGVILAGSAVNGSV